MAMAAPKSGSKKRTASRELRKQQLIKATIKTVAKRGFADTTLAAVAKEAGLSQGIINLHFQSKDRLFAETLRYLSDEYRQAWERTLGKAGEDPVAKLHAMVNLDFSPSLCERNKLAVWFAFWGEAKSRPTYLKACTAHDALYTNVLEKISQEIIDAGNYPAAAADVAETLSAMTDGFWLSLLLTPQAVPREKAKALCINYLASVFPRHFEPELQLASPPE